RASRLPPGEQGRTGERPPRGHLVRYTLLARLRHQLGGKAFGRRDGERRRPIRPAQVTDLIAHQPSWSGGWSIPPRLVEASQESVEHVILRLQVRTRPSENERVIRGKLRSCSS